MKKQHLLITALALTGLAAGFFGLTNATHAQADGGAALLNQSFIAGACSAGQPGAPGQPDSAGGAGGNGGNGGNGASCLLPGLNLGSFNLQSFAVVDCGTIATPTPLDAGSICYLLPTGPSIVVAPSGAVSMYLGGTAVTLPAFGSLACSGQPGAPGQPGIGGAGGNGGNGGAGGSCLIGGNGGNGGNGG
jgi:hypothetical protein